MSSEGDAAPLGKPWHAPVQLDCAGTLLDLRQPQVMGVLNVTPDSFSDGGRFSAADAAAEHAMAMAEAGATIIDIGGESTRPGAAPVSESEECDRVLPVIEALVAAGIPAIISIDSMKPTVMRAACMAGAGLINDVNALRAEGAIAAAHAAGAAVCLMHMQGAPANMQAAPQYGDVVAEVGQFLQQRALDCIHQGIAATRIVLDPGFGFGKTLAHNLSLLKHLDQLCELGFPLLVGMSRKSMLGAVLGTSAAARIHGHDAAVALALWHGARIVRSHDVAATLQAIRLAQAVLQAD